MLKKLKMIFLYLIAFIALAAIGITIFINTAAQFGAKSKGEAVERLKTSNNYKDGLFHNLHDTKVMTKFEWGSLPEYFKTKGKVPDYTIPVQPINPESLNNAPDSAARIYWLGHSSILLQMAQKNILIDPVFGDAPSPVQFMGPTRFNLQLAITIKELPTIDAVLISHDHYDHLDYEAIVKLKDKTTQFFVPLGVGAHLLHWGVKPSQITEMDWNESQSIPGIEFTSTPARHFSGRGLLDRFTTLWCSWVIKGVNQRIFFSGDSGYDDKIFKEIGQQHGPFDFTMLECGQYNQQWANIHSMPEQTAQIQADLQGKLFMPIHWGAFKLALHNWEEPVERVIKAAQQLQLPITTPKIGQPIIIGQENNTTFWWREKQKTIK